PRAIRAETYASCTFRPASRVAIASGSRPARRYSSASGTKYLEPGSRSTRARRSAIRDSRLGKSGNPAETKPPPEGGGGRFRSNQRHGGGGPTVVVSVLLLLAGLESAVADVAVAVLEMTDPPPAVTFRTIVTVTDPPGPRSPGRDI